MAKRLYTNLVATFKNMFDTRTATEIYLSQSKDMCDLESRIKRMHLTQGRFGL